MAVDDAFMEEVTEAAEALNSCQTPSPRFSSFLHRTEETELATEAPQMIGLETPLNETTLENSSREFPPTAENPGPSSVEPPKMVITRREVLAITNILGRIPQTVLNDPDPASTSNFTSSVIEDPPISPSKGTTKESSARIDDREVDEPTTQSSCEDAPVSSGKRRRAKYSLRTHMIRKLKHPVLKFFATGPIDRQKTPYKWWCRVCRVELSLMSRGVLELLSHFRTDSHLVKEHRIRLETPGVPFFDRSEKALTGSALQEAKKVAKETTA